MRERRTALPWGCLPRGLDRSEAAAYIGVSAGTFNKMVDDGRMPQPKEINSRLVWDRHALDRAFDALPDKGGCATDDVWAKCAV